MNVDVQAAELHRLLGYPAGHAPEGRAAELEAEVREWYARHGRPWVERRETGRLALDNGTVKVDGVAFTSRRLHQSLQEAEAHAAVLVAVSAGPEAEERAQELWREEKPDEYFFLEVYASAVVEHLLTTTGARLCGEAEGQGMAVLPHYSPGYADWDVAEQSRVFGLFDSLPGPLEVLDSGSLRPKKSQLAVFGLTRDAGNLRRLTEMLPCENCSFGPCEFRRAPYRRNRRGLAELPVVADVAPPAYSVNLKALRRWAGERLQLHRHNGTTQARFRYDGTTCTNLGRPLAFDYSVTLGSRDDGYPVLEQQCLPAAGDTGHTCMCQFIAGPGALMQSIRGEKPLLGRPLDEVLAWPPSTVFAGCLCDPASRRHKWRLVLETIHYALHEKTSS